MEEWKTYELSDIAEIVTGKTPSTKDGTNFGGHIHFITPGDINKGLKHIYATERTLTESGLHSIKGSTVYPNSICVSCIGNIGYVGISTMKCATNQQINTLIVKDGFNTDFVYYLMKYLWPEFKNFEGQSTTLSILNKGLFSKIQVKIPSLKIQKKIADILSSIDDKIEINNRINHNLEDQIHLLYNQWFEVSNAPYAEVPLAELIDFQEGPGIRNWQYVESNGVKFINIRCINDGDVDVSSANMISKEEAFGKYDHFQLHEMDIVMSCSGTLGRYAIIRKEHLPLCLNTSVIRFKPRISLADYSFVYGYLSSDAFINTQRDLACGSVQANFGPTHLKNMIIKSFASDYRSAFNSIVFPMIQTSCMIKKENDKLRQERDYLLPKLMKGELIISETID